MTIKELIAALEGLVEAHGHGDEQLMVGVDPLQFKAFNWNGGLTLLFDTEGRYLFAARSVPELGLDKDQ